MDLRCSSIAFSRLPLISRADSVEVELPWVVLKAPWLAELFKNFPYKCIKAAEEPLVAKWLVLFVIITVYVLFDFDLKGFILCQN